MKRCYLICTLLLLFLSCSQKQEGNKEQNKKDAGIAKAEKAGLKLAIQSHSFNKFTLLETLEIVQELGIHYIEVYPEHRIGGEWGSKTFGYNLSNDDQKEIKKIASERDIKIVSFGVYKTNNSSDWVKLFRFAKEMELEYISCEPLIEHLDIVEKLASETRIKVGIHNDTQESLYWNPDFLLNQIAQRSPLMGSCSDIGNWVDAGVDEVGAIEKLENRITTIHFKDLNQRYTDDVEKHDLRWGFGKVDIDAVLKELKRQKYNGHLIIEYDNSWENPTQNIKGCLMYYELVTDGLFVD